jgi:hypothetical protein
MKVRQTAPIVPDLRDTPGPPHRPCHLSFARAFLGRVRCCEVLIRRCPTALLLYIKTERTSSQLPVFPSVIRRSCVPFVSFVSFCKKSGSLRSFTAMVNPEHCTKMNKTSTKVNTCGGGGCSFLAIHPRARNHNPNPDLTLLHPFSPVPMPFPFVRFGSPKNRRIRRFLTDSTTLYQALTTNQNRHPPIFPLPEISGNFRNYFGAAGLAERVLIHFWIELLLGETTSKSLRYSTALALSPASSSSVTSWIRIWA